MTGVGCQSFCWGGIPNYGPGCGRMPSCDGGMHHSVAGVGRQSVAGVMPSQGQVKYQTVACAYQATNCAAEQNLLSNVQMSTDL